MNEIDEEVIALVKRLAKTIKKVGVKKVVAVLDELDTEENFIETHKNLISFVIKQTSSSFMVNPEELKRKNIRGSLVEARSMCFILLKKHLELTHEDISGLFGNKNHSLVSNALATFKKLNYDIKTDRKFLEIFNDVDSKVDAHKNLLWLKHK